jgi:hypothetical protein
LLGWYVPTRHREHADIPLSIPYVPALHRVQLLISLVGANVPGVQRRQVPSSVLPVPALYLPKLQDMHMGCADPV